MSPVCHYGADGGGGGCSHNSFAFIHSENEPVFQNPNHCRLSVVSVRTVHCAVRCFILNCTSSMTQFVYPVINTQDNQDLYFPPLPPPPRDVQSVHAEKKINWKRRT
jgi:hypothetical protein